GLPESDGGPGAGAARSVDRHARAPVPAGDRARARRLESLSLQSAAPPPAGAYQRADASLLGRSRSAGAAGTVRRDVGARDPGLAPARVRRVGPRAAPRGARGGGRGDRRVLPAPGGRSVKFYYFHLMPYH